MSLHSHQTANFIGSSIKRNYFLRWIGWSVFCIGFNLFGPSANWLMSAGFYFVGGIFLELSYRYISWGDLSLPIRVARKAAIRPECPENPWISLMDARPDPQKHVEVFCADGKTRNGVMANTKDGDCALAVSLTKEESVLANVNQNGYFYRPTHWRYFK